MLQKMEKNQNHNSFPVIKKSFIQEKAKIQNILQTIKCGIDKFPNDNSSSSKYIHDYLIENYSSYKWVVIVGKEDYFNAYLNYNDDNQIVFSYVDKKI